MELPEIDMDEFDERFEDYSDFEMEEGVYLVYEHGWATYRWDGETFWFHDIDKMAHVYEPTAIFGPLPESM